MGCGRCVLHHYVLLHNSISSGFIEICTSDIMDSVGSYFSSSSDFSGVFKTNDVWDRPKVPNSTD